jgi:hypothetical protein
MIAQRPPKALLALALGFICLALSGVEASEKSNQTLKRLEAGGVIDSAAPDNLDELSNEPPQVANKKCMLSFGHKRFCECIVKNLVAGTSFDNYYRYNTRSKTELGYYKSSPLTKRIIDSALTARKVCSARL